MTAFRAGAGRSVDYVNQAWLEFTGNAETVSLSRQRTNRSPWYSPPTKTERDRRRILKGLTGAEAEHYRAMLVAVAIDHCTNDIEFALMTVAQEKQIEESLALW